MENLLQQTSNVVTNEGIENLIKANDFVKTNGVGIIVENDKKEIEAVKVDTVGSIDDEAKENAVVEPDNDVENEFEKNPNFITRLSLDQINEDTKINLDDVWFVKTMDDDGRIKIEPYIKSRNKEYGEYICCLASGAVYKAGNYKTFSVLDKFVAAKRWQAMELETLSVKREQENDATAQTNLIHGRFLNLSPKYGINCVVTGDTPILGVSNMNELIGAMQHGSYGKLLGEACKKVYSKKTRAVVDYIVEYKAANLDVDYKANYKAVRLDVDYKTVNEYALAYTEKLNSNFVKENDAEIQPVSTHELAQNSRINLEKLFFVTRRVNDQLEVLPCVINNKNKKFIDVSSGNVYDLDNDGGFSLLSGYVSAKCWREMELTCLKIVEDYQDRTEDIDNYLERKMFDVKLIPHHVYSMSIKGIMTKGGSIYTAVNAPAVNFNEFRDKYCSEKLGVALLDVFYSNLTTSTVEEVCKYAREYTTRLTPKIQDRVDSRVVDDYDLRFYETEEMQKVKDDNKLGFFAWVKQHISTKKRLWRLKNDKVDYEKKLGLFSRIKQRVSTKKQLNDDQVDYGNKM